MTGETSLSVAWEVTELAAYIADLNHRQRKNTYGTHARILKLLPRSPPRDDPNFRKISRSGTKN